MDSQLILGYATELRSLLVGHGKALYQVLLIDEYIAHLTRREIHSDLEGHAHFTLYHLTKKSIAQGIRKAYHSVSQKKWRRIQELSALIIDALDEEVALEIDDPPSLTPRRDEDELATSVTESYCQFSRSA